MLGLGYPRPQPAHKSVIYRLHSRARNLAARHWDLVRAHSPGHPATRHVIKHEAAKAAIVDHTGLRATRDVKPAVSGLPREVVVRGIKIPQKPRPPESDECCMSGCAVCVYDLYLSALDDYKQSLLAVRSQLESRAVPLSEWPDDARLVKPQEQELLDNLDLDPSMKAFLILEKKIGQKKS